MTPLQHFDRTKEYWAGWALAHYQWQRGVPFKQMIEYGLTASRVCDMYILHESDISKFIENADIIVSDAKELEKSHAQTGVVLELAKALNCTVEELL